MYVSMGYICICSCSKNCKKYLFLLADAVLNIKKWYKWQIQVKTVNNVLYCTIMC